MRSADDGEQRPSWMGAPGYTPHPDLPPHAPMPGAPPYPAALAHPPGPVGRPARRGPVPALAAATVWAAVNALLVLLTAGFPPSAGALGRELLALAVTIVLAALGTWLAVQGRRRPFWLVLVICAPLYWLLRALVTIPLG